MNYILLFAAILYFLIIALTYKTMGYAFNISPISLLVIMYSSEKYILRFSERKKHKC